MFTLCLIGMYLTELLAFTAKLHHYSFSWFGDLQVNVHNKWNYWVKAVCIPLTMCYTMYYTSCSDEIIICILMTAFHLPHSYEWRDRTEGGKCCFDWYCLPSCSSQTGTNPASIWLLYLFRQSSRLCKCIIYMHDPLLGIRLGLTGNSMQCNKCNPQSHKRLQVSNRKPKQVVAKFHAFMYQLAWGWRVSLDNLLYRNKTGNVQYSI